jgi:hypothetical protein
MNPRDRTPLNFDPDAWRDILRQFDELAERARPSEDESARRLEKIMRSPDGQALLADFAQVAEAHPGLHRALLDRFMFAPARVRRIVRTAGAALRGAVPPLGPACYGCQHALAQHMDDGDGACTQPACTCEQFAREPVHPFLPTEWQPALVAAAERRGYEDWRVSTEKRAKAQATTREQERRDAAFESLVASLHVPLPPSLTPARPRARARALPKYEGGRGLKVQVLDGLEPERWPVLTASGKRLHDVHVAADGGSLVRRQVAAPFQASPLPDTGHRAMDAIAAFASGTIDRMSLLAHQEAQLKHESGTLAELAREVKRLADRPQPEITVKPPDVYIEHQAIEIPTPHITVTPPDVHVHLEPPKPRRVRVEENLVTGERTYIPEEIEDVEDEE